MSQFGAVPEIPIRSHRRSSAPANDIDYEIRGSEMQFAGIDTGPVEPFEHGAGPAHPSLGMRRLCPG